MKSIIYSLMAAFSFISFAQGLELINNTSHTLVIQTPIESFMLAAGYKTDLPAAISSLVIENSPLNLLVSNKGYDEPSAQNNYAFSSLPSDDYDAQNLEGS